MACPLTYSCLSNEKNLRPVVPTGYPEVSLSVLERFVLAIFMTALKQWTDLLCQYFLSSNYNDCSTCMSACLFLNSSYMTSLVLMKVCSRCTYGINLWILVDFHLELSHSQNFQKIWPLTLMEVTEIQICPRFLADTSMISIWSSHIASKSSYRFHRYG